MLPGGQRPGQRPLPNALHRLCAPRCLFILLPLPRPLGRTTWEVPGVLRSPKQGKPPWKNPSRVLPGSADCPQPHALFRSVPSYQTTVTGLQVSQVHPCPPCPVQGPDWIEEAAVNGCSNESRSEKA